MSGLLDRLTIKHLPPGYTPPGGFDCGEPDVDVYICDGSAAQDQADGITQTYIVMDGEELVGFVSIICDSIRLNKEERPTRRQGAPALKVGYMGVQKKHRGNKVGDWILDQVVGIARSIGKLAGIRFITLDSLPRPGLVKFYEDYGFLKNMEEERVRKIIKKAGSAKYKNMSLDEIDLPHISMRYDIRLKAELPVSTGSETTTSTEGGAANA